MSESALPPYVYLVETTVDPAHEAEAMTWYEDIHIPELLTFPGIVSARRYVADDGSGGRRFVTIVGLESPGALETEEFAGRLQIADHGDLGDHVTVTRRTVFGSAA
jgi:hypothetical protein